MTRFYIGTDIRLVQTESGWFSTHSGLSMRVLEPYLALGDVTIVARVEQDGIIDSSLSLQHAQVSVLALPPYRGLSGLARALPQIVRQISNIPRADSVVVARMPETVSMAIALRALLGRIKLLTLVVANTYDLIPTNSLPNRIIRSSTGSLVALVVKRSSAVVYVTQEWLQTWFPAGQGVPTLSRSSVIVDEVLSPRARKVSPEEGLTLISTGQMTTSGKGLDVVIEALAMVRSGGWDARAVLLGDGNLRSELEAKAVDRGVADYVSFKGHIASRSEVLSYFDSADIYVSASRAEGLPRAVVEAMSRGLPVVTTDAGGSSELVDRELVVDIDDTLGVVQKIEMLAKSQEYYAEASADNVAMAHKIMTSVAPSRYVVFLRSLLASREKGRT